MSSYYWPASLPRVPLQAGCSIIQPSTWDSTPVDVGPPIRRKRTTLALTPFTAPYRLTRDQKDTLDEFFSIVDQASFWWPNWKGFGDDLLVFAVPTSERRLYEASEQGLRWSVSLSLMIWP